jgi:hypothetical protein
MLCVCGQHVSVSTKTSYAVERKMKAERAIALTYSEAVRLKIECEGKLREEEECLEALDELHRVAEQERVDALEAREMWEGQLAGREASSREMLASQVEVLSDQIRRSVEVTITEPTSASKKRRMRTLCTAMRRYLEAGFTLNASRFGGSDGSASLGSASASQASMGKASMGSALVDSNSLGSASAGQGQASVDPVFPDSDNQDWMGEVSMGSASVGSAAAGLASMGSASAMVDDLLPPAPSAGAIRRARRQRRNARLEADEAE